MITIISKYPLINGVKMNKFAAYTGYAAARLLDFVYKNFFKLAFLATAVVIAADLSTAVSYERLIGQRFYDFTSWYHNMYADSVGS